MISRHRAHRALHCFPTRRSSDLIGDILGRWQPARGAGIGRPIRCQAPGGLASLPMPSPPDLTGGEALAGEVEHLAGLDDVVAEAVGPTNLRPADALSGGDGREAVALLYQP